MSEIANGVTAPSAERAVGRGMATGTVVGFFVVGAITAGAMVNAGSGTGPALGVGLFAGFWGGPGFGGMLGATLAATRFERDLGPDTRIEAIAADVEATTVVEPADRTRPSAA